MGLQAVTQQAIQSAGGFFASPTVQLWRDWITDAGIIAGVVYVVRSSAEMKQWTKDHTKEDDGRFGTAEKMAQERALHTERRMDGLHAALSKFDEKIGAWYDGLTGRVQETLANFEERMEGITERMDRFVDGKGKV